MTLARGNVGSTHARGTFCWTPALEHQVKRLYLRDGLALAPIAREIGCASSTVQLLLNRRGWMRSKPMLAAQEREWLERHPKTLRRDYVDRLMTVQEIADKHGLRCIAQLERYFARQPYKRSLSETFRLISVPKGRHYGTKRHSAAMDKWFNKNHTVTKADYVKLVLRVTNVVFYDHRHRLDPHNRRQSNHEYELDHRLSIRDAYHKYKQPLPLAVVCHPANLKLITGAVNRRKGQASAFTLRSLQRRIELYEDQFGKVFEGYGIGKVKRS